MVWAPNPAIAGLKLPAASTPVPLNTPEPATFA